MNIKKIPPQNLIKISASISLLLVEKYNQEELNVIKNILYSVANNISTYQGQYNVYKNNR